MSLIKYSANKIVFPKNQTNNITKIKMYVKKKNDNMSCHGSLNNVFRRKAIK